MTHEEALALLPSYALGALDRDVDALEAHVRRCDTCRDELARYLETTARLGEAVEVAAPPPSLRAAVLERVPPRLGLFRRFVEWWARAAWVPRSALASAAALILVVGLAVGATIERQQAAASLALDERGLALLTSTETTVVRLDPVSPSQMHGHWYHRPGIDTQVLVVEFMPALGPGEAYYGWLQRADGSWVAACRLDPDSSGYARVILLGSDGSDVRRVVVTRQTQQSSAPAGVTVLSWPAP